jgi:hypothetical protein
MPSSRNQGFERHSKQGMRMRYRLGKRRYQLERLDAAVLTWLRERTFARVIGVLLLVAALIALLWWVPEWQAARATDVRSDRARVALENELRRTLATVAAGLFVLGSGYIAWRNMRVLQEGQITERFTRAIEQLGATHDDGSPKLELRLGGIYALERIARELDTDQGPVMEILTAYVRQHARAATQLAVSQPPLFDVTEAPGTALVKEGDPSGPRADVQAILTVIGRRARAYDRGETQRLDLQEAHLERANLYKAHLEGAFLREADLEGAHLWEAHLREAFLREAFLREAHLEGADLSTCFALETASLQEASWDPTTKFPEGWVDGKPPASPEP